MRFCFYVLVARLTRGIAIAIEKSGVCAAASELFYGEPCIVKAKFNDARCGGYLTEIVLLESIKRLCGFEASQFFDRFAVLQRAIGEFSIDRKPQ